MSEFCSVANHLNDCRLLLLESGKLDLYRRVRLNISIDDVNFALRDVEYNLTLWDKYAEPDGDLNARKDRFAGRIDLR